ncbi:MAG: thioredoxin family protein [Gemmatimonadaceae bacterium]|jgi:hypothetical protein|nr:thioredoxin family protein [Gemmatimonadaceae bacterium]
MALFPALALAAACALPAARVTDSTSWQTVFDKGLPYREFLAKAVARREGWLRITDSTRVDAALVQRARAVAGSWRLLVVAVDRCGDSMNSVPYLAALTDSVPAIGLRVVHPDDGKAVQQAHRSLDGRTATPTIVLLRADGTSAGCVVELPRALREWSQAARTAKVSSDSLHNYQRTWYAGNRGVGIATEAVEMLEAAASGRVHCARGETP